MHIAFDQAKNERNIAQRGLSFERVIEFDFETAKVWQDTRHSYSESRRRAGLLGCAATRAGVLRNK